MLALVGLLVGCGPRSSTLSEPAPAASPASEEPAPTPAPARSKGRPLLAEQAPNPGPPACQDAACWEGLARAARRRGAVDVGAAHRERAFDAAPSLEALRVWIDALVESDDPRGVDAAVARGRRRGLVVDVARAGEGAAAAPLPLRSGGAPAALIREGIGLAERGDLEAAGRRWAAARRHLGELEAVALAHPRITAIAWRDRDLVIAERRDLLGEDEGAVGALRLQPSAPDAPRRRRHLPVWPITVALSEDGARLVRDELDDLVIEDVDTGALVRRIVGAGPIDHITTLGRGDALEILVSGGGAATIWSARGEAIASYTLQGTTRTHIRAYGYDRRHPGAHVNLPRQSPTWVTAQAMTAASVALGGSDGVIHLFDRASGGERRLSLLWPDVVMSPDGKYSTNAPIALELVGGRVLSVHARGDLVRWDPVTDALTQVAGRCPQPPSRPAVRCPWATRAVIAPGGAQVATLHHARPQVRIHDARSGEVREVKLPDLFLPDWLAVADDGSLAAASRPGEMMRWSHEGPTLAPASDEPSVPFVDPIVSRDGRWLWGRQRSDVWDLLDRRRVDPRADPEETILAVSWTGHAVAIRTRDAVELRDLLTRHVLARVPVSHDASAWVRFAEGGVRALVHVSLDGASRLDVVDPATSERTPLILRRSETAVALSEDGRWVVTDSSDSSGARLRLRRADTGALAHTIGSGVEAWALSADGAWFVWIEAVEDLGEVSGPNRPEWPRLEARALRIGEPRIRRCSLGRGWPEVVAITPDGDALLVTEGALTRWSLASGRRRTIHDPRLRLVDGIFVDPTGAFVLVRSGLHDAFEVRANTRELPVLARLHALDAGGWLTVSASGAVDGSDEAIEHLVGRDARDGPLHDGHVVWDAAHVDGVLARALAGEDVPPPLPRRARR